MMPLPRPCLLIAALVVAVSLRAASLQEQVAAFVAQPRFEGAIWSVKVVSLDSGATLAEFQPRVRQSPASNTKSYVAALALARLGGDHRIRTPLLATTAVGADGVLAGDLVVAGRGDPSWGARESRAEFGEAFTPFVEALRASGVRRILGDIVADGTWMRCPPDGGSWTVDDMRHDYGAEISGVSLLDNYVELTVAPGAGAGAPGVVAVREPLSGLEFVNRTRTLPADATASVSALRIFGTRTVEVTGGVPVGGKPAVAEAPVPRPAQWFAAGLKAALERAGIAVEGAARSAVWPEPAVAAGVVLGEIVSPPLRDLVREFMWPSQNLRTNLVFSHLGETLRAAETPEERRSDRLALDALDAFLREAGIPPDQVIFDEGSGLSRNNLATAEATVHLLRHMAAHSEAEAFLAAHPVAGRDGTLRNRLKGTPAEGNVRAKTGGLRWSATLSGYVTTAGGERVAFSLMLNRHVAAPGSRARDAIDELALLIVRHGQP